MNRPELHALVWSEPMRQLAPRLGLSDKGLTKICARHDIPTPGRGYWAKVAGGQVPPRSPLPDSSREPGIGRLRAFDASGVLLQADELPDEWVIPGVLKKVFPSASQAKAQPLPRKRRASKGTPAAEPPRAPVAVGPDSDGVPPAVRAPAAPDQQPRPSEPSPTASPVPAPQPHALPDVPLLPIGRQAGLPDVNLARRAEYERAVSLATTHQRHQALASMLLTIEQLVPHVQVGAAAVLQAWVTVIREEMARSDPLAQLVVDSILIAASSDRPAWWPRA